MIVADRKKIPEIRDMIKEHRRVLLVESGARFLFEELIPGIYERQPGLERLDVLTCYPGAPRGFDATPHPPGGRAAAPTGPPPRPGVAA